jgi:uracil-DNA glycosylase family 4
MAVRAALAAGSARQVETGPEPQRACAICPRLCDYRAANASAHPDYYNGPAPSFGPSTARLLVVGLAPGLHGANRTGRPFTGDYAGDLLYATLYKFGFARGTYGARTDDGLVLIDAMISNAVRCAPPQNKPTPAEIRACRPFLTARIEALPQLNAIVALGRIAHDSTLAALGVQAKKAPFSHGAVHDIEGRFCLFDSYHCSRYNTNTGRLTRAMFEDVFAAVRSRLSGATA